MLIPLIPGKLAAIVQWTYLRQGPALDPVAKLHPSTSVLVLEWDRQNPYVKVLLSDGQVGWVIDAALAQAEGASR